VISDTYDLGKFLETIREMDYLDMIYCAEQEATEAERMAYRARAANEDKKVESQKYADRLKGFIRFMVYGIKPSDLSYGDLELFRSLCEEYVRRTKEEARCHNTFQMQANVH
jgi:hypothetical protein